MPIEVKRTVPTYVGFISISIQTFPFALFFSVPVLGSSPPPLASFSCSAEAKHHEVCSINQ